MDRVSATSPALRISIIVLTVCTAVIHFSRAIVDADIRVLFTLNGLGYLGLVTMLYLTQPGRRRRLVRRVLMGYTMLTIMFFFVWGLMGGEWTVIGFVDKVIEVVLVGLLLQEERQSAM